MFSAQVGTFGACVIDGFYGGADRIEIMAQYALDRMPDRCALLGHSMGARVALEIWRRSPQRISRLALADTGFHPVRVGEAEKRYKLRDLGLSHGPDKLVDTWLPPMIGTARREDQKLYSMLRQMAVAAGVKTFASQTEALLHRPQVEDLLSKIDCPVMAIVGRHDLWSPVEQHRRMAALIPRCELRIVENAGHMAPAEEPISFNLAVSDWLAM